MCRCGCCTGWLLAGECVFIALSRRDGEVTRGGVRVQPGREGIRAFHLVKCLVRKLCTRTFLYEKIDEPLIWLVEEAVDMVVEVVVHKKAL